MKIAVIISVILFTIAIASGLELSTKALSKIFLGETTSVCVANCIKPKIGNIIIDEITDLENNQIRVCGHEDSGYHISDCQTCFLGIDTEDTCLNRLRLSITVFFDLMSDKIKPVYKIHYLKAPLLSKIFNSSSKGWELFNATSNSEGLT